MRFLFTLKNFWLNRFQNIFMILQIIVILLLLNSMISNVMYNGRLNNYIRNKEQNFYLLSGAVSSTVNPGVIGAFDDFINRLESIDGVKGVGYQIEESVILDKAPDDIISLFYLNPTMSELVYPLSSGRWFQSGGGDEAEIVIGGELTRRYRVGDRVVMKRATYRTGTLTYDDIPVKIVGELRNPPMVITLNYRSNQPTFSNVFESYENVVLCNHADVLDTQMLYTPMESVLIQLEDRPGFAEQDLTAYGQLFSFQEIEAIGQSLLHKQIREVLPSFLILLSAITLGLIGTTFLFVFKYIKNLSIYHICGMSRRRIGLLIFSQSLLDIVIAFIISSILFYVPLINQVLFQRTTMGLFNLVGTLTLIAVFLSIIYIYARNLTKQSSIGLLRRYE